MLGLRRVGHFSWRRVLLFGSAFTVFWIFVFSLTPITSPLPPYTGQYEVGVLDIETEVEKRVIHDAVLKESGQPAFELDTLAITLYYPSLPPVLPPNGKQPLARPWLPQPISLIGTGYARLARVYFPPFQWLFTFAMWALGSKTVIPGHVDSPLLDPAEKILTEAQGGSSGFHRIIEAAKDREERLELREEGAGLSELGLGKLPCVVFTHGMAGMSQSYSHYLGSIASHGYVVAAVEHRDGSGPGTIVHYPNGKERKVWHVQLQDLQSEPAMTEYDLKIAQLAFREAEMIETIRFFQRLNDGVCPSFTNLKPKSPEASLPGFKNRLDLSAVTIAGHSYGATGAMQALKTATDTVEGTTINGGIALDPGKASGPLNTDISVPLLVMQSGEWTEKQTPFYGQGQHFEVVRKIVSSLKNGWYMTLTGTAHPSCTDAPLIVPWIMKMVTGTTLDPKVALREYIDVSVEFLEYLSSGKKTGVLASPVTSANGPLGDAEERKKVEGTMGAEWEVHVVPAE